jgi:hypothetical protein
LQTKPAATTAQVQAARERSGCSPLRRFSECKAQLLSGERDRLFVKFLGARDGSAKSYFIAYGDWAPSEATTWEYVSSARGPVVRLEYVRVALRFRTNECLLVSDKN